MICSKCHHTHEAHTYKKQNDKNSSLMMIGECIIPECSCRQYVDPIIEIDEEML